MTKKKLVPVKEYEALKQAEATVNTLRTFNSVLAKRRISDKRMPIGAPQEDPDDVPISIQKIVFPQSGGTLTVYKDIPHNMKGFCDQDTVDKVDEIKTSLVIMMHTFRQLTRRRVLGPIFLLLFRTQLKGTFNFWVESNWNNLSKYLLKDEMYCDMVRELRRVWPAEYAKLRDIVSMLLEFDDAYRYRIQDAFGVFDQACFRRRPIRELQKFFAHLEEHEETDADNNCKLGLKSKWRILKKMVGAIRLDIDYFILVRTVLAGIDIEKVRLSVEDRYWCQRKYGYKWPVFEN